VGILAAFSPTAQIYHYSAMGAIKNSKKWEQHCSFGWTQVLYLKKFCHFTKQNSVIEVRQHQILKGWDKAKAAIKTSLAKPRHGPGPSEVTRARARPEISGSVGVQPARWVAGTKCRHGRGHQCFVHSM
jgi:hypothetical protein